MQMPHQRLGVLQVVPALQEGRAEGMAHNMEMDPLLDQCLLYHGIDEAVNTFVVLLVPAFWVSWGDLIKAPCRLEAGIR